jgi:hypothetical protein
MMAHNIIIISSHITLHSSTAQRAYYGRNTKPIKNSLAPGHIAPLASEPLFVLRHMLISDQSAVPLDLIV